MIRKFKVGLDFDGVISNCGKLKSDGALKLYGVEIPPEKFKKEIVVGEELLTAEQYRELQKIIYGTRDIGLLMEPVDGVLDYLPWLVKNGYELMIITSRGEIELEIAKEWCGIQGLKLNFVSVGYGESKAEAATGFDVYVDDDLDKLEPLVNIVPYRFLFSWGYNAHMKTGAIANRVISWKILFHHIRGLEFTTRESRSSA